MDIVTIIIIIAYVDWRNYWETSMYHNKNNSHIAQCNRFRFSAVVT